MNGLQTYNMSYKPYGMSDIDWGAILAEGIGAAGQYAAGRNKQPPGGTGSPYYSGFTSETPSGFDKFWDSYGPLLLLGGVGLIVLIIAVK